MGKFSETLFCGDSVLHSIISLTAQIRAHCNYLHIEVIEHGVLAEYLPGREVG